MEEPIAGFFITVLNGINGLVSMFAVVPWWAWTLMALVIAGGVVIELRIGRNQGE